MKKTVRDAAQCVMGLGGAVVRAMPSEVKAPFVSKAEELGRQIASDNGVDLEGEVPDGTELSPRATALIAELSVIKADLLKPKAA